MEQLKIGVLGARRGGTFIQTLQSMGDRACLYAVCENDPIVKRDRVDKVVPEGTLVFTDYDEFLDCGLDAVILCNFFHEHASFAIKALKKGIAVLSETTAAATLGECVELCKAVEETGTKYMLAANGPFKASIQYIKEAYENGKLGDVHYAEAEYLHYDINGKGCTDDTNRHWRRMLPGPYYNMHTLGTLMYVTGSMPKKVTAAVLGGKHAKLKNSLKDHDGAKVFCVMDNGARFETTGCTSLAPTSKWYRFMCENGAIETERYSEGNVWFVPGELEFFPGGESHEFEKVTPTYDDVSMVTKEELYSFSDEQKNVGHPGIDFWLTYHFVKYLRGEHEPFFNVYRATALSAAAIMGWKSVLDGSKEYEIPDFSDKEGRKKYENDYLSPFADPDSDNFITYCANKETK